MVKVNELQVLWVKGQCSSNVAFITDDVFCCSCSNYIKVLGLNGTEESFNIGVRNISCITANKESGMIAVSETKLNPVIHILKYPELQTVVKTLQNGAKKEYLGMEYSGEELLITVTGDPDYVVVVWNWVTGCKMFTLEQTLHVKNPQNFQLSVNPSKNFEFCMHNSAVLTFFTIDDACIQMNVSSKSLYMPWVHSPNCDTAVEENQINDLTIFDKMGHTNWGTHSDIIHKLPLAMMTDLPVSEIVKFHDYVLNKKRMVPSCHCWLPFGNIAIGCTNGFLFNLQTNTMKLTFVRNLRKSPRSFHTKLNAIMAMAVNTVALYVGKQDGTVWMLTEANCKWSIKAIIVLDILIKGFSFTPDYNVLTVLSIDGSIFLHNTTEINSYTTSRFLHCEDNSPIVGICTPYKSHCLIVRRNGLLEIWDIDNGIFVSKLNINCHLECADGSPLCSLAFIGTKEGQVYIIDATNIKNPRVLKVYKVFEQTVKTIKCENFGRYVVTLSSSGTFFIISAIVSSNFSPLGRINTTGDVVDVCIFTKSIKSPTLLTLLLNLPVSLPQKDKENHLLMEILLPKDFYKNYKAYWRNDSGLLNDGIQILKRIIYSPKSSIVLHEHYGALVYQSNDYTIKNIKLTSYKGESELTITTPHETEFCSLWLNNTHNWLASTGNDGKVAVYELANLSDVYILNSVHPFTKDGRTTCACFIESKSVLITGSEDGVIACHGWNPQSFHEKDRAQCWNMHCWSWKAVQNKRISKMIAQSDETPMSWESWSTDIENKAAIEELTKTNLKMKQKLEGAYAKMSCVADRNYKLPPEYQLKTEDLFLDHDILIKMTKDRTTLLLSFSYELFMKLQKMKAEALEIKAKSVDRVSLRKSAKPLCQGDVIYNYSYCQKSQQHKDRIKIIFQKKQCQIGDKLPRDMLNEEYEKVMNITNLNELLLYNSFDLKSREQIIDQINILQDMVYQKKIEFNKKFHNHVLFKESQKDILVQKIARLKFLNTVLEVNEEVWEPDWNCDETPEDYFEMPPLEVLPNNNFKFKSKPLSSKYKQDDYQNIGKKRIAELENLIKPRDETEDQLLCTLAKPDFMENVLPVHWTKSECKIVATFDIKLKKHETSKKKYLAKLKWERVHLKAEIDDLIHSFDNIHQELLTERLNTDFYINFNELTMAIILFVVSVNDQLVEYEKYLKKELWLTQRQNKPILSMIESAQKSVHKLTKAYEGDLNHDKEVDEVIKMFCRKKQNNTALDLAINSIEAIANSKTNNPFSEEQPISKSGDISQILQELVLTEGQSKYVSKHAWKWACSLLLHKISSEKKLKQGFKNLNDCKTVLQKFEKRKDDQRNHVGKLVESMTQGHQKKILALNDIPYAVSMEYKNMEIENQSDISASYFMIHRRHIDEWMLRTSEMRQGLLNAIRYGARVRHDLKINFINYRRLNFKIEEYQKKITMIDNIPLTKDLKVILASDEINPSAKSQALIASAEYEETELLRQIAAADLELRRIKKEIVAEIKSYKELEKRIYILKRDLSQLNECLEKCN